MSGPRDLTPREARDMFLDKRRTGSTELTVQTYYYRLTEFVRWCDKSEIDRITDLSGWDIDRFEAARRSGDRAPTTIRGSMVALKQLLDYCERIGAVDHDLPEKVDPPTLSKAEMTDDTKLSEGDATAFLNFYRESPATFGTDQHALLEVLWSTGARLGGVRALDLGDYSSEKRYLDFRHRPGSGTPLKNKDGGERPVAIPEVVCDVLDTYIARERWDKRDDHGRKPLFSSYQGRPSPATFRAWAYLVTEPCVCSGCPHGNRRGTCDLTHRNHASKCPSSRSPHQIRTGSITWQRSSGLPRDVVSERVNASPEVIDQHYDKPEEFERLEYRQRKYIDELEL
ncbi:MAG: site-specific integrase [Euryarchaeota archaeon]|nr:site-specific integrase [Euryarchaeota archaeon]